MFVLIDCVLKAAHKDCFDLANAKYWSKVSNQIKTNEPILIMSKCIKTKRNIAQMIVCMSTEEATFNLCILLPDSVWIVHLHVVQCTFNKMMKERSRYVSVSDTFARLVGVLQMIFVLWLQFGYI